MGWYGDYSWQSAKDVHASILRELGAKALDHAATNFGRHLWVLVELPDQRKLVAIYLCEDRGGSWAYKPMSEDMGPYVHDCPKRILDAAEKAGPPMNEYSRDWRAACRAFHAKKAAVKVTVPPLGTVVLVFGQEFRLEYEYTRTKMAATRLSDGKLLAVRKTDIKPLEA